MHTSLKFASAIATTVVADVSTSVQRCLTAGCWCAVITDQLDGLARWLAGPASKVWPSVKGAGVYWDHAGPFFWDQWREPRAWTARVGRVDFIIDLVD